MSQIKSLPVRLTALAVFGLVTTQAWAQESAYEQEQIALRSLRSKPVTLEFKPLPTAVTAAGGNGTGSVGVGAEIFASPRVAIFADASYSDLDLPNNLARKANDSNRGQAVPKSLIGYDVTPGIRFYGEPTGSTWFTQAGVGYATAKGKFNYEGQVIDSKVASIIPSVEAGYRWLFSNNVLLRAGIGAVANEVQSHTETATQPGDIGSAGESKVSKLVTTPVLAAVDLGLGYAF